MWIKIISKPSGDKLPEEVKEDLLGLEFEVIRRKVDRDYCLTFPRKNSTLATIISFEVDALSVAEALVEFNKENSIDWWCRNVPLDKTWIFEAKCCKIIEG